MYIHIYESTYKYVHVNVYIYDDIAIFMMIHDAGKNAWQRGHRLRHLEGQFVAHHNLEHSRRKWQI